MQGFIQALDSCVCKAIFGHWSCHAKNRLGRHRRKLKCACTLLGLKNMTMYERVKPTTAGPVTDTHFELKMLCLFYFVLESENTGIISRLQWYFRNNYFFPFIFFLYLISIPDVI